MKAAGRKQINAATARACNLTPAQRTGDLQKHLRQFFMEEMKASSLWLDILKVQENAYLLGGQPPAVSRGVSLWGSTPPPLSSTLSGVVRSLEGNR
ncbi:hypothetical protein Y1Q_0012541 [Alligator mississippiensis]|uniref:Uncharacterized protein n=1 Tax=Alligator mississippiensis TaxID=8496 RepID=A0A151M882_ALLMI|nr:hypothetical protein Y1Q_0012541 [Alligator mississippiensis]